MMHELSSVPTPDVRTPQLSVETHDYEHDGGVPRRVAARRTDSSLSFLRQTRKVMIASKKKRETDHVANERLRISNLYVAYIL